MKLNIIVIGALTIFSFIIRIIHIDYPMGITWDEIYHVKATQSLLHGEGYFIDHPPFGRQLIALGILIFGDKTLGWRVVQAICGTMLIPLSYFLGKKILTYEYAGLLTAFFVSFDLLFLTYSRVGLADIFLIFFIVLSFLFFTHASEKDSKWFYILSAINTGLAISIKWTALILFPMFLLWLRAKGKLNKNLISKLLFIMLALITYTATFLSEDVNFKYVNKKYHAKITSYPEAVYSWHKLALSSHTRKNLSHSDSSKWYTWPLMYKPVWMHFKVIDNTNKKATCIVALGNPVIWWLATLAVLFQLCLLKYKKDKITFFLLSSYLISFLPYALIKRPMFLYHYLTTYFFSLIILEHTFVSLYKEKGFMKPIIEFLSVVIVLVFFYLYPFVNAYPVSYSQYQHRLWLESWKFEINGWKWG